MLGYGGQRCGSISLRVRSCSCANDAKRSCGKNDSSQMQVLTVHLSCELDRMGTGGLQWRSRIRMAADMRFLVSEA